MFGWRREEAVGQRLSEMLIPMRYRSDHEEGLRRFLTSGEGPLLNRRVEITAVRRDGSEFPVEVSIAPYRIGGTWAFSGFVRDITERKDAEAARLKLEERLRQAEKMEAVGRLAAGIAHDFNNVLGGIFAYGEMLYEEAPENSSRKRRARKLLTAATRGRELVEQILAYSRSQGGKREPTDIGRMVAETLELVRASLPPNITVESRAAGLSLVVMSNATQLHQVIMNVCTNAIHALG